MAGYTPDARDSHPSWGMARVNKVQSTGRHLFDSEITHQRYVILSISGSTIRDRSLHRDWLHPNLNDHIVEVAMSEAQWGALVSSFGDGAGVPVTITDRDGQPVEQAPHESRLAKTAQETRAKADTALKPVVDALAELGQAIDAGRKTAIRQAFHDLSAHIGNLPANLQFAADSLTEHAENVVTKAKADIEAMVAGFAAQHGVALDPGATTLQLGPGEGDR